MALTDEQAQELMDTIAEKCEAMELDAEQIIDGIGRAMMSATHAFEKSGAIVKIEGFGTCEVKLVN